MPISQLSIRTVVFYVLLSGAVLFLAVFLGIRAGLAVQGTHTEVVTPDNLPNKTTLKMGDLLPDLPIRSLGGRDLTLSEMTGARKTVIAVVLPGCDPCKQLLAQWQKDNLAGTPSAWQIVLLAAGSRTDNNLDDLAEFQQAYPVYFCDVAKLTDACGISSFPSLVGVGADRRIRFVASGLVYQLDRVFFDKYL